MSGSPNDGVRVWLVVRTYSDDEQYFRKERAVTSFTDIRDTAAVDVAPGNLGQVDDPDQQARYAAEARWMREHHDPEEIV